MKSESDNRYKRYIENVIETKENREYWTPEQIDKLKIKKYKELILKYDYIELNEDARIMVTDEITMGNDILEGLYFSDKGVKVGYNYLMDYEESNTSKCSGIEFEDIIEETIPIYCNEEECTFIRKATGEVYVARIHLMTKIYEGLSSRKVFPIRKIADSFDKLIDSLYFTSVSYERVEDDRENIDINNLLEEEIEFEKYEKNGKLNKIEGYYKNGKIAIEIPLKNDKANGWVKMYDKEKPVIKEELELKEGIATKNRKEYNEQGILVLEMNMEENGKIVERLYHENGNIYIEKEIRNGVLNGKLKEYYKDGKLKAEGDYKNGELEGELRIYYESGKLYSKGNYKKGEKSGEYKEYYENGNIRKSYICEKDEENKEYETYYESGEIHYRGYYIMGRILEMTKYDKEGNILAKRKEVDEETYIEIYKDSMEYYVGRPLEELKKLIG